MKYKTITVFTNHNDADLISSAMFDAGAGGVSILDKQDFLDLVKSDVIWDYVDESVLEQSEVVKVSTMYELGDKDFEANLEANLEELKKNGVQFGEILKGEIDAADYENEWKKYYNPIKTKNITIVPTWIEYNPGKDEKSCGSIPAWLSAPARTQRRECASNLWTSREKTSLTSVAEAVFWVLRQNLRRKERVYVRYRRASG